MPDPNLTIVVPAYDEAGRIGSTLEKIRQYAASKSFPIEMIVVDDGSNDRTTEVVAQYPEVRLLRNGRNRGKGFSVRRGALEARGKFIIFSDADLSTPIEEADRLLDALESAHADAAAGSRALQRELIGVHQPRFREWGGRCFNLLVRLFTGLNIRDTQCGFKLFRRSSTRRAFELQRVEGFGFDPELLYLIQQMGAKIIEVPVHWNDNAATKVHFLRDSIRMFFDLVAFRWRVFRGEYGF